MSSLDSVVGFASAKQSNALDLSLRVGGAISNHSNNIALYKIQKICDKFKKMFSFLNENTKRCDNEPNNYRPRQLSTSSVENMKCIPRLMMHF